MLDAAVHLTDDLDGLTHLVVEGEKKHRRIHHARSLVIESAEQLREVARVGTERFEPTRKLESHVTLLLTYSERGQHVPPRRSAEMMCLQAKNKRKGSYLYFLFKHVIDLMSHSDYGVCHKSKSGISRLAGSCCVSTQKFRS